MKKYALNSGITVNLDVPVEKEISIGDFYILLLNPDDENVKDSNVICFDKSGKFLWKAEPFTPVEGDENPFANIRTNSENQVIGETWKGVDVLINLKNGKASPFPHQRPW